MNAKLPRLLSLIMIATLVACATTPTGRRQLSLVSEERAIKASKEAYLTQMSDLSQQGKLVTAKTCRRVREAQ